MHEYLRKQTAEACLTLAEYRLCDMYGGVVSVFDRKCGVMLIRPAHIRCSRVTPLDIIAAMPDGTLLDGDGELPFEFAAHRVIYEAFPTVCAIASSNPTFAAAFAQAGRPIKPYGTSHAAHFSDLIPCSRKLTPSEIEGELPEKLGGLVVETLREKPEWLSEVGAVLTCSDGVYALGGSAAEAVERLEAVESSAKTAFYTELLMRGGASGGTRMQEDLLQKRFRSN